MLPGEALADDRVVVSAAIWSVVLDSLYPGRSADSQWRLWFWLNSQSGDRCGASNPDPPLLGGGHVPLLIPVGAFTKRGASQSRGIAMLALITIIAFRPAG